MVTLGRHVCIWGQFRKGSRFRCPCPSVGFQNVRQGACGDKLLSVSFVIIHFSFIHWKPSFSNNNKLILKLVVEAFYFLTEK